MNNQLPQGAYELMEARDEQQILEEIKGSIITEMFYSFKIGDKEVTGVSWVGTKEIARRYGSIRMDFIDLRDMGDDYMAVVRATDTRSDTGMLGTSLQSKEANGKPDRFASTKAISKAQRNAIRAVIPEKYLLEMYSLFRKGAKPAARKTVDVDAEPMEEHETQEEPPRMGDEERRVAAVLEANGLSLAPVTLRLKGSKVYVEANPTFPRERFGDYDRILKTLRATWASLENRWEVPAA